MKYEDIMNVNAEMKYSDIKGKAYAEVPSRVQGFRKLFPEGTIETEMISNENGVCVFKATAKNGDAVLATGHAYEREGNSFINKTSYIENCETSAIGRCLGFIGLGSEMSIASYEEVQNAKLQQNAPQIDERAKQSALDVLRLTAEEHQVPIDRILKKGRVKTLEEMNLERINNCINWINGGAK